MICPVILSGGSGTRLWPLSRELYPKQLLPLVADRTMLQRHLEDARSRAWPRLASAARGLQRGPPLSRRRAAPRDRRGASAILLEPCGRNTAPAVAVAALQATELRSDPILLVLPADHVIRDADAFGRPSPRGRRPLPAAGWSTFGIVPTRPETGYGYILARRGTLRGTAWSTRWPNSSKSRTWPPPRATWLRASISGTAACSCSRASAIWRSWSGSRPRCSPPAATPWTGRHGDLDFTPPGRRGLRSLPVRLHRLRRHGEDRPRPPSCPSMPAGATSARGRRSGRWAGRTRTAT